MFFFFFALFIFFGVFGYLHFLVSYYPSHMNETFHDEYSNEPSLSYLYDLFYSSRGAEQVGGDGELSGSVGRRILGTRGSRHPHNPPPPPMTLISIMNHAGGGGETNGKPSPGSLAWRPSGDNTSWILLS